MRAALLRRIAGAVLYLDRTADVAGDGATIVDSRALEILVAAIEKLEVFEAQNALQQDNEPDQ